MRSLWPLCGFGTPGVLEVKCIKSWSHEVVSHKPCLGLERRRSHWKIRLVIEGSLKKPIAHWGNTVYDEFLSSFQLTRPLHETFSCIAICYTQWKCCLISCECIVKCKSLGKAFVGSIFSIIIGSKSGGWCCWRTRRIGAVLAVLPTANEILDSI